MALNARRTIIARGRTMVAATVLLMLVAVGCTREVTGAATGPQKITGTTNACTFMPVPMVAIPTQDDEPRVLIPELSGWDRITNPNPKHFRFAMGHGSPPAGHAELAVGLKSKPGHDEPARVFDEVRRKAENDSASRDLIVTHTKVCGYPAQALRYTLAATDRSPTLSNTELLVVAHTTGKTYAAAAIISTDDPGSPAYQQAADTMLRGFQVLAPTG
jgi:hypothetical protein